MMILIERLRHFPRFSLSLTSFNFILALWLSLGLNVAFFEKIHALTPYAGFKSWAFVTATILLLICSVHDKFHRTLILSGFCLLKIAKISLNSSFFPKPIKR